MRSEFHNRSFTIRSQSFTIRLQSFTIRRFSVSQSDFRVSQSAFYSFTIRFQSFTISLYSFTIRFSSFTIQVAQSAWEVSQSDCQVSQSKLHNPLGKFHNPSAKFHNPTLTRGCIKSAVDVGLQSCCAFPCNEIDSSERKERPCHSPSVGGNPKLAGEERQRANGTETQTHTEKGTQNKRNIMQQQGCTQGQRSLRQAIAVEGDHFAMRAHSCRDGGQRGTIRASGSSTCAGKSFELAMAPLQRKTICTLAHSVRKWSKRWSEQDGSTIEVFAATGGNRFYVANGAVSEGTQRYAHKCPDWEIVWSRKASGRILSAAQNEGRKEMQTAKLEQQINTERKNCPRSLDTVPKLEEREQILASSHQSRRHKQETIVNWTPVFKMSSTSWSFDLWFILFTQNATAWSRSGAFEVSIRQFRNA